VLTKKANSEPVGEIKAVSHMSTRSNLILNLFLSAVAALILTEVVGYSRNILLLHPEWISSKRLLANAPMGANEAYFSRNILYRNRLNLHAWHGFNEILLNRVFSLGLLRFKFFLGDNGYLNIVFNKNKDSFCGVRLSRNPKFPSMFFQARTDGKFLLRKPIQNLVLSQGWHASRVTFEGKSLVVECDGLVRGKFPVEPLRQQVIGFRSGNNVAIVDDVEVLDSDGKLVQRENFRNHWTGWLFYFSAFASLLSLNALIFHLCRNRQRALFSLITLELFLIFVLFIYGCFDYYFWSAGYRYKGRTWGTARALNSDSTLSNGTLPEKLRVLFFTHFPFYDPEYTRWMSYSPVELIRFLQIPSVAKYEHIMVIRNDSGALRMDDVMDTGPDIQSYLAENPFRHGTRILFLGTSQMWGSGASSPNERIASRVSSLLNTGASGRNIYVINASERGSNSFELLNRCKDHLYLFRPDLVILDLSNNDDARSFDKGLRSLLEWTRSIHSKTLFILEPNSPEVDFGKGSVKILPIGRIQDRHAIMRNISTQYHVPLLDLNGYLTSDGVYDSGFLWWDLVHLTSYGQELAAEFIAKGITDHFPSNFDKILNETNDTREDPAPLTDTTP
jgi:lysophospholipase L1-like esterase